MTVATAGAEASELGSASDCEDSPGTAVPVDPAGTEGVVSESAGVPRPCRIARKHNTITAAAKSIRMIALTVLETSNLAMPLEREDRFLMWNTAGAFLDQSWRRANPVTRT